MHNLILFLVLWPVFSLILTPIFTRDENKINLFCLRSFELSAVGLAVCFILHVTGIVPSISSTILGVIIWGGISAIGEFAERAKKRESLSSLQSS